MARTETRLYVMDSIDWNISNNNLHRSKDVTMSLVQSFRYYCSRCKNTFRFNNQCRCKLCGFIDAQECLSCHNLKHDFVITMSMCWLWVASAYFAELGKIVFG